MLAQQGHDAHFGLYASQKQLGSLLPHRWVRVQFGQLLLLLDLLGQLVHLMLHLVVSIRNTRLLGIHKRLQTLSAELLVELVGVVLFVRHGGGFKFLKGVRGDRLGLGIS